VGEGGGGVVGGSQVGLGTLPGATLSRLLFLAQNLLRTFLKLSALSSKYCI
jgi:hypothetical protein